MRGLRIATRCTTIEQFVSMFHQFCEDTTVFISRANRAVGHVTAFSFDLADGSAALSGVGTVTEVFENAANRFGRPGIVVTLQQLGSASARVFDELLISRAIADNDKAIAETRSRATAAITRVATEPMMVPARRTPVAIQIPAMPEGQSRVAPPEVDLGRVIVEAPSRSEIGIPIVARPAVTQLEPPREIPAGSGPIASVEVRDSPSTTRASMLRPWMVSVIVLVGIAIGAVSVLAVTGMPHHAVTPPRTASTASTASPTPAPAAAPVIHEAPTPATPTAPTPTTGTPATTAAPTTATPTAPTTATNTSATTAAPESGAAPGSDGTAIASVATETKPRTSATPTARPATTPRVTAPASKPSLRRPMTRPAKPPVHPPAWRPVKTPKRPVAKRRPAACRSLGCV